jgi:hypothetical protein
MEFKDVKDARKSSYSGNGGADCVTVGRVGDGVAVLDSKQGDRSPVLAVPPAAWRNLVSSIKTSQTAQ